LENGSEYNRIALPEDAPFSCLGYKHHINDGIAMYHYQVKGSDRVFSFCGEEHCIRYLLQLAPLAWFEGNFQGGNLTETFTAAIDALYGACEAAGPYNGVGSL